MKKSQGLGGILAVMLKAAKLIKVVKLIKVLKPLFSLLTVMLSWYAYSPMFGVQMAGLFVLLLLIHELGHVWVLKKHGFGVRLPLFIPFVGAMVFAPRMKTRDVEAEVGYGGPFVGTIAALLCIIPYFFTHNVFWAMGATIGVWLNLFNMIPISPLDGGRITQAVHRKFKWLGILLLIYFTLSSKDAGMLVIWIIIVMDLNVSYNWKRNYSVLLVIAMLVLGLGFGFNHSLVIFWIDVAVAALFV